MRAQPNSAGIADGQILQSIKGRVSLHQKETVTSANFHACFSN